MSGLYVFWRRECVFLDTIIIIVSKNTNFASRAGHNRGRGLNPAAINRMLYGRRNIRAEEIPMIEDYIGTHLNLSAQQVMPNVEYRQDSQIRAPRRGFSEAPAHFVHARADIPIEVGSPAQMVPVYGFGAKGVSRHAENSSPDIVDWVARHPSQFGIVNAFALYVFSDAMEPRYFRGELVYLHPGRPPEMNRDCLFEMKNGDAFIGRFIRQSGDSVRVAQFNPAEEQDVPRQDIALICAVVGRN